MVIRLMMSLFGVFVALVSYADIESIKDRGRLVCGVTQGLPGFSSTDDSGNWKGLDVDLCRAMATAIFDDETKVDFKPLSSKVRFTALNSGEVDILSRVTTWTMSRDVRYGNFIGVNYYDGQGFMIPTLLGASKASELGGSAICTNTGTSTERNIADYFTANNMPYTLVSFEKSEEARSAYESGRCDVYTADRSGLASMRTRMKNPNQHMILDDIISKEPLGPMVSHNQPVLEDIARWSLNCMVNAEEFGITSTNVDKAFDSNNPSVLRLLGQRGNTGEELGLASNWCANIISKVGNYGESYEKHLGKNTPIGLARGLNALWTTGGILYAPPIR